MKLYHLPFSCDVKSDEHLDLYVGSQRETKLDTMSGHIIRGPRKLWKGEGLYAYGREEGSMAHIKEGR